MRRVGIRDDAQPCGKVSAEQVAGAGIPIGEQSSTCQCYRPRRATARAEVMIVTGASTPLEYLLKPILTSMDRALREK